jgi:hypothetical protein
VNKHQLVEAAPKLLDRVLGNDFRTNEEKVEFIDFLEASLSRVADALDAEDADLNMPLADLFGRLERERNKLK